MSDTDFTDTSSPIAVIGAGPAGLSAALTLLRRNFQVVVYGPPVSEKLRRTTHIENYLGLSPMSGEALSRLFHQQVEEAGASFSLAHVQAIYDMGGKFGLLLPSQEIVKARGVVLATGVNLGKTVPGEAEFFGRGASNCATCDAPLYRNKKVVVVGANRESVEEANYISELAAQTTFINLLGERVCLRPGIEEIADPPVELCGGDRVEKLVLRSGRRLTADGFFFIRDAQVPERLVPGLATQNGHILVDAQGRTNLPYVVAAGDCTGKPYQIQIACGEGQKAALTLAQDLQNS